MTGSVKILLPETWDFRLDEEPDWRPIPVPGCWEQIGVRRDASGPGWYRARVAVPAEWAGRRLWLRFGAVSYHCQVFVNGLLAGEHTGLWDSFAVEITGLATPGELFELLVRVEKPAGLISGPDSATLPGRFPLRETLSGFLPYVAGHIFGGIWQAVELLATGPVVFADVLARGDASGRLTIEAALSAPADVEIELRDPEGQVVFACVASARIDGQEAAAEEQEPTTDDQQPMPTGETLFAASFNLHPSALAFGLSSFALGQPAKLLIQTLIPQPRPWAPDAPALYEARLRVADGDERVVRFGLRSLRAAGTAIELNGRPIYPRMALSWGWYADSPHGNPGPARVRADFERLRGLGYNGVKLCLWFPPQYYFELADELGMLLWVELPMWIPRPTPAFRAQVPIENARLMRLARNHPSVILYTIGCELSGAVGADMLAPLFAMVKRAAGDALVRDNSGSGEAYGGLLNEFAEFYDYHFYAELQHFRSLLDHFSPRWRPVRPWLFGEFCEADTFRDLRHFDQPPTTNDQPGDSVPLAAGRSPLVARPWWLSDDPALNPQGARWIYHLPYQERRLRASGLREHGAEIERVARAQALAYRKHILEQTRLYAEVSGYVVTGEVDTPIGAVGMLDDWGRPKFDPDEFRSFNADLVALVAWDRRRAWVAGGDRAAPWDVWCYPAGASVRPHLVASQSGASSGPARVTWSACFPGEPPFASGSAGASGALAIGDTRELAVAEFVAPPVASPRQAILSVEIDIGAERAANRWPLWIFPRDVWWEATGVALFDPPGRLSDLARLAPRIDQGQTTNDHISVESPLGGGDGGDGISSFLFSPSSSVVIATAWTPALRDFVARGGRAVLLLTGKERASPLPMTELPFWRETIRLAEPHPAWADFPLDDALATQLLGCAADHALDTQGHAGAWRPILRRLDGRSMRLHEYAVELTLGEGSMIVSTLRIDGGQGSQPLGVARNTAAAYLLWCWARYLQSEPLK